MIKQILCLSTKPYLNQGGNDISTLPSEIGHLTELTFLDLGECCCLALDCACIDVQALLMVDNIANDETSPLSFKQTLT